MAAADVASIPPPQSDSANLSSAFPSINPFFSSQIIAILAAILFPVFARAREQARTTACLSNLKQLALAVNMYAQDYDESVPHYRYEADAAIGRTWWQLIDACVMNRDVWRCASADQNWYSGTPPDVWYAHFGWNYRYLGWPGRGGTHSNAAFKLAEITHPAETICIAESNGVRIAYAPSQTSGGQFLWLSANPGIRHNGGANYAFVDGHAKWLSQNEAMRQGNSRYWTARR